MIESTLVVFAVVVLWVAVTAYAAGVRRAGRDLDAAIDHLRTQACGDAAVWRTMLATAVKEGRVSARDLAADNLAWSNLHELDQQVIAGASRATIELLRREFRRRTYHSSLDDAPPSSPPSIRHPLSVP